MSKINYFIVLLTLSIIYVQCDESQIIEPNPEVLEEIKINSIEYVNKYLSPDRLENTSAGYNAIDLNVNINQAITNTDVKRIYLYAADKIHGIGWELNNEEINVTDSLIHIPNLVLYNTLSDDSKFDVVLELHDNRRADYTFIHKGLFPSSPYISTTWYNHNTISVSFTFDSYSPRIFEPDSITFYWLNNDNVIDSTLIEFSNTINIQDIPNTAVSYFMVLKGSYSNVEQVLISNNYSIPEKLPDNLTILKEIDVYNISDYSGYTNNFLSIDSKLIIMSSIEYASKIFVYDVVNKQLIRTHNFDDPITSFSRGNSSIFIGFYSGNIIEFDIKNGDYEQVYQFDSYTNGLISIDNWLVVSTEIDNSKKAFSLNLDSLVLRSPIFFGEYSPRYYLWSEVNEVGYSDKGGSTYPYHLMKFSFDLETGIIRNITSSRYNVGYTVQGPIYFLNNETQILTSSGTVFNLDMEYLGRYQNQTMFPLAYTNEDYLFSIRSNTNVIDKYNLTDRFLINSTSLMAPPKYLFNIDKKIYALVLFGDENERLGLLHFDLSDFDTVPNKEKIKRVNYPTNF